jgi:hypothetical protein
MANEPIPAPQIEVKQISALRDLTPDRWILTWEIRNLSPAPLAILAARLPHGQFRSLEQELSPAQTISPHQSAQLECAVECREEPGSVVENAFIILRVLRLDQPWRIFVRLRVTFDAAAVPHSVTEIVTAQQIGFSQKL